MSKVIIHQEVSGQPCHAMFKYILINLVWEKIIIVIIVDVAIGWCKQRLKCICIIITVTEQTLFPKGCDRCIPWEHFVARGERKDWNIFALHLQDLAENRLWLKEGCMSITDLSKQDSKGKTPAKVTTQWSHQRAWMLPIRGNYVMQANRLTPTVTKLPLWLIRLSEKTLNISTILST